VAGAKAGWRVQGVLGDVVMERCGHDFKRMWQVLTYIGGWGLFYEANGRAPRTDREYSSGVNVALGTSHRWRTAFAETFPEFDTPLILWEQVNGRVHSETVEVAALEVGACQVELAV
jgi:hypothetical protein